MQRRILHALEAISVAVFFLQALRVVFSVMFGIIYDQIFEGPITIWLPLSNLLVIAALVAPLLAPRSTDRRWMSVAAALAALARVALTVNEASVRYWGALVVLAAGGVYLAGLLMHHRQEAFSMLVAALVLDQVLRAAGHTYDVSLRPLWLPVQAVWGIAVTVAAFWPAHRAAEEAQPPAGMGLLNGLALGGWLFVETSLLALPNGVARWSRTPYEVIAPLLLLITWMPLLPAVRHQRLERVAHVSALRYGAALLLPLGLMVGYFASGIVAALALLLAQVAALIALLILLNGPFRHKPSAGSALALGMALFLILNFLNAFAFTYPYTLPLMRGMGWAVYLVAGLATSAVVAAVHVAAREERPTPPYAVLAGGLAALVVTLIAVWPQPVTPFPAGGTLRLGTYNIHYGYDDVWHLTLEEIAQTIEDSGADIVALQEVDTGRMTSYLIDNAYYLARRLRMHAVYLPTVEHLTGIALLTRAPLIATDGTLVTSLQEQTGVVHAQVEVGSATLYAYGIWMGLADEDTQTQIREALDFIGGRSPAMLGGDFNTEPGSPVARAVEAAGFVDPFVALDIAPAPPTDPAINPRKRIDFVWVRGLEPLDAWVPDSLASDHRMVVVEVALPSE